MEPFRGVLNILIVSLLWLVAILITWGIAIIPCALWLFFVFSGAEKRLGAAADRVQQTLMPTETLTVATVQLRPFALLTRRKALGITDSRIIVISRGLFGGFTVSGSASPSTPMRFASGAATSSKVISEARRPSTVG